MVKHRHHSTFDLGLVLFYRTVVSHPSIGPALREALLETITASRRGEPVDQTTLREALNMLVTLGVGSSHVYEEIFERPILEQTELFYRLESGEALVTDTVPHYLQRADDRMREEKRRARYFPSGSTTGKKLAGMLKRCWIADNAVALVESETGAAALLRDRRLDDLRLMFGLLEEVPDAIDWDMPAVVREAPKRTPTAPVPAASSSSAASVTSGATSSSSSGSGSAAEGDQGVERVRRRHTPLDMLREMMRFQVMHQGRRLVQEADEAKDPSELVQRLLELQAHYDGIVQEAFKRSAPFVRALKESFEWFVNLDTKCAQSLSLFLDGQFRKGFFHATPAAIEQTLNGVIVIFRFLRDKDVFESFYKTHLQKRLLTGRSISDEAERAMIAKLKAECGVQFTSKFEGMFADLTLSRVHIQDYKRHLAEESGRGGASSSSLSASSLSASGAAVRAGSRFVGVPMDATVLTMVHWSVPVGSDVCLLPPECALATKHFQDWYLRDHSGRRLRWNLAQGSADVRMLFTSTRFELRVTTYQMCILQLFNRAPSASTAAYLRGPKAAADDGGCWALSLREIREGTHIPEEDLRRHLISLTTPRAPILVRVRPPRAVASSSAAPAAGTWVDGGVAGEGDALFALNAAFKSPKLKIAVPLVTLNAPAGAGRSAAPGEGLEKGVPEHVQTSRCNMMDAAIVRIMKARKTMDHASLVAETTRQLQVRFHPSVVEIKKRIESLLERDYLERDDADSRKYHYVA